MTSKVCAAVALALVASAAAPVRADVQLGEYATLSGFGTLGVVRTDTDQARFGKDRQPDGADRDADALVDSNLGVQLTVRPLGWLSGTVQMLAQRRDDKDMNVDPEWAFVKIQPLADLDIRLGRMGMPTFLVSDFRNVGYANTWLRAPNEVYALAAFRRLEGGDVSYRLHLGDSTLTAQAIAGTSGFHNMNALLKVEHVRGGNLAWERDGLTLRAGRMEANVVVPTVETSKFRFTGFGAAFDRDNIVAQAEYVQRRALSAVFGPGVSADAWYGMSGYRFGSVTPYISYANTKPRVAVNSFHLSDRQDTKALGVRWDAFSSAAFKFQVEQVNTDGTPGISFDAPVNGNVHAFSASIDFTF